MWRPIQWIAQQIKDVGVDSELHLVVLTALQDSQDSESSFVRLHVLQLSKDALHLNPDTSKSLLEKKNTPKRTVFAFVHPINRLYCNRLQDQLCVNLRSLSHRSYETINATIQGRRHLTGQFKKATCKLQGC